METSVVNSIARKLNFLPFALPSYWGGKFLFIGGKFLLCLSIFILIFFIVVSKWVFLRQTSIISFHVQLDIGHALIVNIPLKCSFFFCGISHSIWFEFFFIIFFIETF